MPTRFDHFGPEAWTDYEGPHLTSRAKRNRELLKTTMEKYGFKVIRSEWWHFDYKDWQSYPSLDIPISQLK